jgi:hypothetical protein
METASELLDRPDLLNSRSEIGEAPAVRGESGREGVMRQARGLVRFLYSSNPFYILSADLVFVGLRLSFGAGGPASRTVGLLCGLGGYTLLLATTACVLIRLGDHWDDLRSLLLLILMILMAIAMSGDDVMAAERKASNATFRFSLLSRRLLNEDIAKVDGRAGPDDEFPADLGAVGAGASGAVDDAIGRAGDQCRPCDPPVGVGDPPVAVVDRVDPA